MSNEISQIEAKIRELEGQKVNIVEQITTLQKAARLIFKPADIGTTETGALREERVRAAVREASAKIAKSSKARGKTAPVRQEVKNELPPTNPEWWMSCITKVPNTYALIFDRAINKLGFTPTPDQRKKLKQRMSFYLADMSSKKEIKKSGKQGASLYSKKTTK